MVESLLNPPNPSSSFFYLHLNNKIETKTFLCIIIYHAVADYLLLFICLGHRI